MAIINTHGMKDLSYKILIDRYAMKESDKNNIHEGDLVIAILKDEGSDISQKRELGIVQEISQNKDDNSMSARVTLHPTGNEINIPTKMLDKPIETSPQEIWDRIAKGVASVEPKEDRKKWEKYFRSILDDFKFVPGGRIMAMAGTGQDLTAYNCFVIDFPHDSRGGIMERLSEMAEIMSRGGGVGINISSLRPKHAYVKGVNGRSSGAVSWGALYSFVTGLIEQGGSRRGALMIILHDTHPDLIEFINSKRESGKIENANISVGISDKFMQAVKDNGTWLFKFPDTTHPEYDEKWNGRVEEWEANDYPVITYGKPEKEKEWDGKTIVPHGYPIPARNIWNIIIESAWASAEPGLWFRDRAEHFNNLYYRDSNKIVATNPCVTGDTRIYTDSGIRTARDLFELKEKVSVATDSRLDAESDKREISKPVFSTGEKEIFLLQTREGHYLKATIDHRIMTPNGWAKLGELSDGDKIYILNREGTFGNKGSLKYGRLKGHEKSRNNRWLIDLNKPEDLCKIPDNIWHGTRDTQRGFVQGLFEESGEQMKLDGSGNLTIVLIEGAFLSLARNIQMILLNFGVNSKITGVEFNNGHFVYRLVITGNNIRTFVNRIGIEYFKDFTQKTIKEYIKTIDPVEDGFIATVDEIKSVGTEEVFDLTEPITHSFVANGIVVHNCGEQNLSAYSVCNLGAINLSKFYDKRNDDVNWKEFKDTIRCAVRFLDNVIDHTPYHLEKNERQQKNERRIGLGIMGLHELMIKLGIRYGSDEAAELTEEIFKVYANTAYEESALIAGEKGSFPLFNSKFLEGNFVKKLSEDTRQTIKENGMRNSHILTIAPTGSTGSMSETSTGIEPFFSWKFYRKSRLGMHEETVDFVQDYMDENDINSVNDLPDQFVTAMELTPTEHVKMQAAAQKWIDQSISKTVNAPNDYTIEQTSELYQLLYDMGCKGGTIYRDGSRHEQVLSTSPDDNEEGNNPYPDTELINDDNWNGILTSAYRLWEESGFTTLPSLDQTIKSSTGESVSAKKGSRSDLLQSYTMKGITPYGNVYITISEDPEGIPFELFITIGKSGTDLLAQGETIGRLISNAMQSVPKSDRIKMLKESIKQMRGVGGGRSYGFGSNRVSSLSDAVAKIIDEKYFGNKQDSIITESAAAQNVNKISGTIELDTAKAKVSIGGANMCPECGNYSLVRQDGCRKCNICGHSEC